jgi:hypothetical protein
MSTLPWRTSNNCPTVDKINQCPFSIHVSAFDLTCKAPSHLADCTYDMLL